MSPRALEEIIYFAAYVVIDPKGYTALFELRSRIDDRHEYSEAYVMIDRIYTPHEHKSIMTEREYRERLREYGYGTLVAKIGAKHPRPAQASRSWKRNMHRLKEEVKTATGQKRDRSHPSFWMFRMPFTSLQTNLNGWFLTSFRLSHQIVVQCCSWMVDVWTHLTWMTFTAVLSTVTTVWLVWLELNAPRIIAQNEKRHAWMKQLTLSDWLKQTKWAVQSWRPV